MSNLQSNNCKVMKCLVSTSPDNVNKAPDKSAFIVTTGSAGEFCCADLMVAKNMREILPGAYVDGKLTVTAFDKAVMDGVYTLWCERSDRSVPDCDIALPDIFDRMNGGMKMNPGTDMRERIKVSVYKLMHIGCMLNISCDLQNVVENLGLSNQVGDDGEEATIYGHLLEARLIKIKRKNRTTSDGIKLLACPILYQYAEALKHIIQVEEDWLRLPFSYSEKLIAIRDYLISYIKGIKHRKMDSCKWVGYQTIFQSAGLTWSEYASTQSKNRKFVNKILEYYQAIGLIAEYIVSDDLQKVWIKLEEDEPKKDEKKSKEKKKDK